MMTGAHGNNQNLIWREKTGVYMGFWVHRGPDYHEPNVVGNKYAYISPFASLPNYSILVQDIIKSIHTDIPKTLPSGSTQAL